MLSVKLNRTQTQIKLENLASVDYLDQEIAQYVSEQDVQPLVDKYQEYIVHMSNIDNKHTTFHTELLNSIPYTSEKIMQHLLRVLVKALCTQGHGYIERNVIAFRLGKKLLPKSLSTGVKGHTAALSLGLNLINFAATVHLISYKMISTIDKHSVSTLQINKHLVADYLKDIAAGIRASRFMVVEPKPHTPTQTGGLLKHPRTMLNSSGFNSISTQSSAACYAINKLQAVPYSIRRDWNDFEEYMLEDKWFNDGVEMITEKRKFASDFLLAVDTDEIYFPLAFDDRGRIYETSGYIKYQGDKYQKSMLQFADVETLTQEGMNYLKIAIVNELHSDKISFEESLQWFNDNISITIDAEGQYQYIGEPLSISAKYLMSDLISGMNGNEVGTITHWDCTNSGLQIYSVLGRDKATASLCNVVDTGTIADAYQSLADILNSKTDTQNFTRTNVKKAFMTFLYGAMSTNILHKLEDHKANITSGISSLFPSNWSTDTMWDTFREAMYIIAPSAIQLMELIYKFNLEGVDTFSWTMPDGFKVECSSTEVTLVRGWFLDHSGKTHEGSIDTTHKTYQRFSRALAPNVVHSIDGYIVRQITLRADFAVSAIHDSFGCHPNNVAALHQIVREVYADVLEMNLLGHILAELNPSMYHHSIRKGTFFQGTLTAEDIRTSKYIVR